MSEKIKIFLCYSRQDEEIVESLYNRLSVAGFIPWMDKMDLVGGERWADVINKSIRESNFFIACLSKNSVNKRGFLQREIKVALDVLQELFNSDIYLLPLRLENCDVPEAMKLFQWVDYFRDDGWDRLLKSIIKGMERWGIKQPKDILGQGVEIWNSWREENPEIRPNLDKINLSSKNLQNYNFDEVSFTGSDLSFANLVNASLIKANLSGADLSEADLSGAILDSAILIKSIFKKTKLENSSLSHSDIRNTNFSGAYLKNAKLNRTLIDSSDFSDAYLGSTDLKGAYISSSKFRRTELKGATLIKAVFTECDFSEANLEKCKVYGVSTWRVNLTQARQFEMIISAPNEPLITVDNLESAHLIYMLLDSGKVRTMINSLTNKTVLILGRLDSDGFNVLKLISNKLRTMDYLPITFDFVRPAQKTYSETIRTLVGFSRFIIANISGPSIPQELYSIIPHYNIPVCLIIEKNKASHQMLADLMEYDWVLKPIVEYTDAESLIESIPSKIVKPAENRILKRQELLCKIIG